MAAQNPPFVIQGASHSAALFRQTVAALLGRTQPGSLASTAGGVVNPTDMAVTQNGTPNMSVNVAGGFAFIPQTQVANGGLYGGLNDATLNLAVSAANATNPRIDLVVAVVLDKAYSGATTKWTPQVLTGTPTAGATLTNKSGAPALPAASIPLAYVLVPANATSIVTADIADVRTRVAKTPAGRQYQSVGQSLTSNVYAKITSLITDFTTGGVTASATGLTVTVPGIYQIDAQVTYNNGAGGTNQFGGCHVYVNGSTARFATIFSGTYCTPAVSDHISLPANALVTIYGFQANTSAAAKSTTPGSSKTFLSLSYVGPA